MLTRPFVPPRTSQRRSRQSTVTSQRSSQAYLVLIFITRRTLAQKDVVANVIAAVKTASESLQKRIKLVQVVRPPPQPHYPAIQYFPQIY